MMAVTYPGALKSSKISFWPVNGYIDDYLFR